MGPVNLVKPESIAGPKLRNMAISKTQILGGLAPRYEFG